MSDKRAIKKAVELLRKHGRGGDTILAHINPKEAEALKAMGGSGQPNPKTGLPEFLRITSTEDRPPPGTPGELIGTVYANDAPDPNANKGFFGQLAKIDPITALSKPVTNLLKPVSDELAKVDPFPAITREVTNVTQPVEKAVSDALAKLDKDLGLSKAVSDLFGKQVEDVNAQEKELDAETQRYIEEQRARAEQERIDFENKQKTYAAQVEAQRLADQEAFNKAQAEIEELAQKERDVITRQAAEYDAQQKKLQEEAAAEALRLKAEQAALEQQRIDAEQQAELVKEKARTELEGVQRESAERESGRKRAARSATARPLLMGAAPNGGQQALGYGGSMGGGGTLGSTQTLGVG